MKKVIRIFIIIMYLLSINVQIAYASDKTSVDAPEVIEQMIIGKNDGTTSWSKQSTDFWKPTDEDVGQTQINDKAKVITTIIRNVGIVISVIALMVIGIREMYASVEEKTIIKQSLPGYILGVIMIAGITTLPSIIYNVVKG